MPADGCLGRRSALTTVVMGDFNDWMWPGSVQNVLARKLPGRTRHRTFPARFPLLKLDRIYCRPASALLSSRVDPVPARSRITCRSSPSFGRRVRFTAPSSGMLSSSPQALQCTASGVVALQPACRARETHLVWLDERAREAQEQRDAEDHDHDRDQASRAARQRDVAEAGGGQRRDGEVERVDIVADLGLRPVLGLVDYSRS